MGASERNDGVLPPIPDKRYFTIGEVSELCLVKPYVLRYWEQEFVQLKPMKRRGNRRYYQHHEVLLVRRIRELLYDQGFTIHGARNQLLDVTAASMGALAAADDDVLPEGDDAFGNPAVAAEPGWPGADGGEVGSVVPSGTAVPVPAALLGKAPRRGKAGTSGAGATRALQASPVVMAEAWISAPDLSGLQSLGHNDVQALREALLSIRDLLA